MNRGAISVIYLALSAVCLVGLYGVYKPNINAATKPVFSHVEKFVGQANWNTGSQKKDQEVYIMVGGTYAPDVSSLGLKYGQSEPVPESKASSILSTLRNYNPGVIDTNPKHDCSGKDQEDPIKVLFLNKPVTPQTIQNEQKYLNNNVPEHLKYPIAWINTHQGNDKLRYHEVSDVEVNVPGVTENGTGIGSTEDHKIYQPELADILAQATQYADKEYHSKHMVTIAPMPGTNAQGQSNYNGDTSYYFAWSSKMN